MLKPFTVRLEEELAERLAAYCKFIHSDKDYVVAEALKYVIDRDKEFAKSLHQDSHLKAHQETRPAGKPVTKAAV